MIYFADWYYLLLLPVVAGLIVWQRRFGHRLESTLRFTAVRRLQALTGRRVGRQPLLMRAINLAGLTLLILALARPQGQDSAKEFLTEGIDIVLLIDISSSMRAVDFKPNRLEAAKSVARQFIEGRSADRIGLIVFAAESFLQCPLTIDYAVLKGLLEQVNIIEERYDGTAIGLAIANAVNRLRDSSARSRVMILLSDGRNNAGELDPATAADMAAAFGIRIYTIGAGKQGQAPYPITYPGGRVQYRMVDVEIDEEVLTTVAQLTGGRYFRATDETSLAIIYDEISRLEKTIIKVKEYTHYREHYPLLLAPALGLLTLGAVLGLTVWRKCP